MIRLSEILKQPEGRKLEFKETLPANVNLITVQWGNGLRLISQELHKYPEIGLEWKEPGIAFRITFVKKNFVPAKSDEIYTDVSEKTSEKTSGKTSGKILELIESNKYITIPEIAAIIGVTGRSIRKEYSKSSKRKHVKAYRFCQRRILGNY